MPITVNPQHHGIVHFHNVYQCPQHGRLEQVWNSAVAMACPHCETLLDPVNDPNPISLHCDPLSAHGVKCGGFDREVSKPFFVFETMLDYLVVTNQVDGLARTASGFGYFIADEEVVLKGAVDLPARLPDGLYFVDEEAMVSGERITEDACSVNVTTGAFT